MTTKFIAMLVGIAAIASLGGAFALVQTNQPTSMHADGMKSLGHVDLTVFGPDGTIKAYRQTDNLVVNNGDNATVSKLFATGIRHTTSSTINPFIAVGVGTGSTGPTTADTALGTQVGHKVIATLGNATATHGNVVLTANFAAGKITNSTTSNIAEAGIFDNTSANLGSNSTNLFARQTFTSIGIGPSDTLQITWTVNVS